MGLLNFLFSFFLFNLEFFRSDKEFFLLLSSTSICTFLHMPSQLGGALLEDTKITCREAIAYHSSHVTLHARDNAYYELSA